MVRTRKVEIEAVLALLGEEWADETELAQALLDKVFELLADRNFYGVKWGATAYGPFLTKQSAEKVCRVFGGDASLHHLVSTALLAMIADRMEDPPDNRYCDVCKHPTFAHGWASVNGCAVKNCGCTTVMKVTKATKGTK